MADEEPAASGSCDAATHCGACRNTCGTGSARTVSGNLYCWGDGLVGNGTVSPSTTPARVSLSGEFTGLAVGAFHSCAILQSGEVRCWGENGDGQLGDGTLSDRPFTTSLSGGVQDWIDVTAEGNASCGQSATAGLHCWGDNSSGQVGNGTTAVDSNVPALVNLE